MRASWLSPTRSTQDEPTSGLDSTIAARLVGTLHGLASAGRAFAVSIHQPATRVFKTFDVVMLLSEGRVLYHGPPDALAAYFAPLGFVQPSDSNPADWLLDLASGEPTIGGEAARAALVAAYTEAHPAPEAQPGEDEEKPYGRERARVLRLVGAASAKSASDAALPEQPRWPTGFAKQTAVLVHRNITARAEGVFDTWRLGQVLSVAILSGLLWLNVGDTLDTAKGVGDVAGLIFFEILFLVFLSMVRSCVRPSVMPLADARAPPCLPVAAAASSVRCLRSPPSAPSP